MCWYSKPAADTSPAFGATRSGWWMNGKAFTIPNTRVVCRNFLGLWRLKNWKIRIADRQWSSNSSIRGKTNTQKQKPKVTYSMALLLTFFAAENENRQPEDLPLTDFGRLPERLLLSVRTKSINENLEIKNYDHCCFCNHDSTHFSILRVSANALYDCYLGIVDSFIFIH